MAQEKAFENKIKKYIESVGGWQVKFFANSHTRAGIPDILSCINGFFVAIEVKAQNGRPSELQKYHCDQIRKAGGFAFIVYPSGWEPLKKFIDELSIDYIRASYLNLPLILK